MSINLKKTTGNYVVAAGVLAMAAMGACALSAPEYVAAATDTAGSASGYYVSVSSADSLTLALNATPGGTVGSVQDTLTVSSNTPNGYKVYISATSSGTGANYLCPAGVTPSKSACFVPTNSADSLLALTTNSWGYSLNGSSYSPVPLLGSEDEIISKTTATSESSVTMPIYFGVKADMAMSGSYTGSIMYTTVANTTNASNKATISPSTVKPAGGETLTVNIPYISSRTEAEIKDNLTIGIGGSVASGGTSCAVASVAKITSPYDGIQVTCTTPAKSAGSYDVVATVTLPQGGMESWTASGQLTYVQPLQTMQAFASSNACSSMSTGQTKLVKDARDDKEYRIRKLKDGKCWMIDNLRLGEAGKALTLTTADSNVSSTKTIQASNIVNSGSTSWGYDEYHIYVRDDATFTKDSDNYGTYYNVSGNDYGNLYSWYTATAGTGTKSMSHGAIAGQSICPKGWILPQNAEGTGSFKTLYNSYNSQSLMTTVAAKNSTVADRGPEFKLAGLYYDGVSGVGSGGRYWSRTAYGKYGSDYYAYNLYPGTSSVDPRSYYYQHYGFSVRCIAS